VAKNLHTQTTYITVDGNLSIHVWLTFLQGRQKEKRTNLRLTVRLVWRNGL